MITQTEFMNSNYKRIYIYNSFDKIKDTLPKNIEYLYISNLIVYDGFECNNLPISLKEINIGCVEYLTDNRKIIQFNNINLVKNYFDLPFDCELEFMDIFPQFGICISDKNIDVKQCTYYTDDDIKITNLNVSHKMFGRYLYK